MADRIGSLITFKAGVTNAQAAAALERMSDVLDVPEMTTDYVTVITPPGECNRAVPIETPFEMSDIISYWDDEMGGPVWYIP